MTSRRTLFLCTFAILSLELALIRWMSQQVTLFAYLGNVLLIGAFLGMGLGVALGRRKPALFHLALPALALLSAVLAFSEKLGILRTRFPSASLVLWGAEGAKNFTASMTVIVLLFCAVVVVFLLVAVRVGEVFDTMAPLEAYSIDLAGSLAGVVLLTLVSATSAPPPVWFALAGLPLAWMSKRWTSWLSLAAILVMTALSIRGAVFSPYYRIDFDRATDVTGSPIRLSVNRDFHQYMHDFSPRHLGDPALSPVLRKRLAFAELTYRLPFALAPRNGRALVVGGGTGNDVAAGLRQGFQEIVSVDIDPRIIEIGKSMHPERPYSDPRVIAVVNDARAYFERNDEQFDAVVFGLLDSHAAFSSMSSLRLDNYVYTVEAIRSAWRHVRSPGVMSISFAIGDHEWLSNRLYAIVKEATGVEPIILAHPLHRGRFFIATKGIDPRALVARNHLATLPPPDTREVRATSDDWPFLYLNPEKAPVGYFVMLVIIVLIAAASTRAVFGRSMFEHAFDPLLFVLGAAFLLVETRSVTNLSLLFGSTWIVNAAVFAGVLAVVYLANTFVAKRGAPPTGVVFMLLFASLLLSYCVRPADLLSLPYALRSVIGPIVAALPIGFAGLIFSSIFATSKEPSAGLGSNLLGAVVGGCLEFLSMIVGLRAIVLLALALYLIAFGLYRRRVLAVGG